MAKIFDEIFTKELLIELYKNQRMSMVNIGKLYGCSEKVVRNRIKKYNIELNSQRLTLIPGQRYGKLTADRFVRVNEQGSEIWNFRCDCGNNDYQIRVSNFFIWRDCVLWVP